MSRLMYRLLLLVTWPLIATAAPSVAPVFSSGMVWPCENDAPLWGIAEPCTRVTVDFGAQHRETLSTEGGFWSVVFAPMPASATPTTLAVRVGEDRLVLTNILVGDVWLAAGQSNMRLSVKECGFDQKSRSADASVRVLCFTEAATGDRVVYSPNQRARLGLDQFFTGSWCAAEGAAIDKCSAVAWSFARAMRRQQPARPLGIIQFAVGGSPIESWISEETLRRGAPEIIAGNWLDNKNLGSWCRERARFNLGLNVATDDPLGPDHPFKPGFLWSRGPARLASFPLRGALWYQGESNAEEAWQVEQYRRLFPLLVDDLRHASGSALPVLTVQLPGMDRPFWPAFRDVQRQLAEKLPGVGMVCTIDLGERKDVHPKDKLPVGERLAQLALNDASGPWIKNAVQAGDAIRLTFRHAEGLATRDGKPPRGFEVAGADGIFRSAAARIEGGHIVVEGRGSRIRYGWQPFPDPPLNLVNQDGLPALPFATALGE